MFTRKLLAFFAIAIFTVLAVSSEISAQQLTTFNVDAKIPMNTFGETINKGDMVYISDVSGTFTFARDGRAKPSITANEGFEGKTGGGQYNKLPGGGLAVGTSMNDYTQAKPGALFIAKEDGEVFFGINDTAYQDNSGGYDVTYAIIRKQDLKTFEVSSTMKGFSTNVETSRGDLILVTAVDGSFSYNSKGASLSHDKAVQLNGLNNTTAYKNIPGGVLVVGTSDQNNSQVTKYKPYEIVENANLGFGINDSHYADNTGSYMVTYAVIRHLSGSGSGSSNNSQMVAGNSRTSETTRTDSSSNSQMVAGNSSTSETTSTGSTNNGGTRTVTTTTKTTRTDSSNKRGSGSGSSNNANQTIMISEVKTHSGGIMEVVVDAKQKMIDTGISINAGDGIEVTSITGTFYYNAEHEGFNYSGNVNGTRSGADFEYSNAAQHSLVMLIGGKSNYFQVVRSMAFVASSSGHLFFAINDQSTRYSDNRGGYTVYFRIIRSSSGRICSPPSSEKVDIHWVNKTGKPVRVNWVSFECEEQTNIVIQPNESFDGQSFVGHIFRVREEGTNNDLGLRVVKADNTNDDIFISN